MKHSRKTAKRPSARSVLRGFIATIDEHLTECEHGLDALLAISLPNDAATEHENRVRRPIATLVRLELDHLRKTLVIVRGLRAEVAS